MNKKLLFAAMSLAALTACTDNDFESQKVAEEVGSVQFEVLNNNDAFTRASMNGNKISWSATAGDLFTLYHGGTLTGTALSGYQNATYKASEGEGSATLTSPTMITAGPAIMVWPADTMFYAAASGNLTVKIPTTLENIENNIPYASDLITILPYAAYTETAPATAYNTAGKDRKYAVHMRPMASQLILKADYAGTDAAINALATGSDPIDPIALTSVDIKDATTSLTKEIDLSFAVPTATQGTNWATEAPTNAWTHVTAFDLTSAVKVGQLTTKCINGVESAKFLILPQAAIGTGGLLGSSIVVNTTYGKVDISAAGGYSAADLGDAWYRYMAPGTAVTYGETETTTAGTGDDATKVRYTQSIEKGLAQVIDVFSANTTKKATSVVVNEPTGAVGTRYVKVLLTKLDMDGLHITSDQQLYNAVRVWKELGLGNVTVYLDGKGTSKSFEISQRTIKKINELNKARTDGKSFSVAPCATDVCDEIVVTGGDKIEDMTFIVLDGTHNADVVLKAEETWKWDGTIKLATAATTGVKSIINKGTLVNAETKTLKIMDNATPTAAQITTIPLKNEGIWNITAGDLNVQFDVNNIGTVNISDGAEYHQDGASNIFTNDAETLPQDFLATGTTEKFGVVNNSGVFATVNSGVIDNFGLIDHVLASAKTYITHNQTYTPTYAANASFASAFNATVGSENKMGRINLPYSNKDEENVSISNGAATGFVSVTVSTTAGAPANGKLDLSSVGAYVNYCKIEGGVTEISVVDPQIEYVEFNAGDTEIAWTVAAGTYNGLIVFSPVNVHRGTTITVNNSVYLKAKMYVGGTTTINAAKCSGYFGNTSANFATKYITY